MEASNFDWMAFALGLAAALVLATIIRFGQSRRSRGDLSSPPRFPLQMGDLSPELRSQILSLKAEGRTIEAIKLVRERTGQGLKEAKDIVEAVR
jgi:large subunit ribosomal protein L7/L12